MLLKPSFGYSAHYNVKIWKQWWIVYFSSEDDVKKLLSDVAGIAIHFSDRHSMPSQRGHQPLQPHIGFTILNIVDPFHSPSAAKHAFKMRSHLPSMKTSCPSRLVEKASYLNTKLVFYFGKQSAWCKQTLLCGKTNFSYWLPALLHLWKGESSGGVICVVAEEIGLLFHRSHFLLWELLPHEPVDVSIFQFLLNEKEPFDLQAVLSPGRHNDVT